MEAYTNIKIEMENKEIAMKAVEEAKRVVRESKEKNVPSFIEDIVTSGNEVIVENSCTLDSDEYNNLVPLVYKAIASMNEVNCFEAISNYVSCNCGYEANIKASYENETLTIKSIEAEDFNGYCEDCGEIIVHYEDYDPNETYICKDCGKALTEEELFPEGLPEVVIEHFEI